MGGPLAGSTLPIVGEVEVYRVWEPPTKLVKVFTYPEHVEPPPGCRLLGTYTVATGAANRGKLLWEAAS